MTGWRLGYGVWPKALRERADAARRQLPLLRQRRRPICRHRRAAGAAGRGRHAWCAAFAERRRVIVDALNRLPGVRCVEPGGAFYAFPNISGTGLTRQGAADPAAGGSGVATIAGTSFGAMGEGFLRLPTPTASTPSAEAIDRMAAALA